MARAAQDDPTAPADRADLIAFAYSESVRSLSQQANVLDNIRTRAGLVITAANVVTALLAAPAIQSSGLTLGGVLAFIAFAVVGALSVLILVPQKGWNFRFGGLRPDQCRPLATLAGTWQPLLCRPRQRSTSGPQEGPPEPLPGSIRPADRRQGSGGSSSTWFRRDLRSPARRPRSTRGTG